MLVRVVEDDAAREEDGDAGDASADEGKKEGAGQKVQLKDEEVRTFPSNRR